MRFFHIGDLHFGKLLHSVSMVEKDQPYWVEHFLDKVDEYAPDAVVISGDIYDRQVPSKEAVALFNHMLTELAKRDRTVIVISGNHDSGVRLSFAGDILSEQKIHIAGEVSSKLKKVTLSDTYGEVDFWMMPFLYPRIVADKTVLDRDDITGYGQAVRELLAVQEIDESRRNVIVVHQNVISGSDKPQHSESESIVGGLGEVDASLFDKFEYAAMGHIHNAQRMGRNSVRYSGCPMYYDFSEANRKKFITMVDIGAKGEEPVVMEIEVPLLHRMKVLSGTFDEIINQARMLENPEDYHIQARVSDRHFPVGATEKMRSILGDSLINVVRDKNAKDKIDASYGTASPGERKDLPMEQLFESFYSEQNSGEDMEAIHKSFLMKVIEQQARSGACYYDEKADVPEGETEEIIAMLLKEMGY